MRIRRRGRCAVFAGNSVWSTSERLVVEILTIGAMQIRLLSFPFLTLPCIFAVCFTYLVGQCAVVSFGRPLWRPNDLGWRGAGRSADVTSVRLRLCCQLSDARQPGRCNGAIQPWRIRPSCPQVQGDFCRYTRWPKKSKPLSRIIINSHWAIKARFVISFDFKMNYLWPT